MGRHQPAILGGLLIGVLSSLPIIKAGNICCCLWVVAGGALTVYLQQQRTPEPVQTGDAVIGGLLAGLIGGAITCVATYLTFLLLGPVIQSSFAAVQDQIESNPDMPAATREMVQNFIRMLAGGGAVVIQALITLPTFAVFSMLGSLLGTALFRKKQPPLVQQG